MNIADFADVVGQGIRMVAALPLRPAATPRSDQVARVTISPGAAWAAVQAAGDALYLAKRAGKNQVAPFHVRARDRRPGRRRKRRRWPTKDMG
jgi:hypothetical protein